MLIHQSSTRRKACTGCVKAKRRCNMRFPQCSRCVKRTALCEYEMPPKPIAETIQEIQETSMTENSPDTNILALQDYSIPSLSANGSIDVDVSANFEPFPISSFSFPERTVVSQGQVDFCISQFKTFIPQLVQQNRAPFIHPDSYKRLPPLAYQDLLGISALYVQKSPQNQKMIFSILDSRVHSLIASSKSSTWVQMDYLVGVQALIIYQIIRLFDGDIRQRVNAERDSAVLESWTFKLSSMSNTFSRGYSTEFSHQSWIFIESIRRTVMISVMVQAMYSLVKDGYCTSVPLMGTLPVTVDGALWDASEETWWQSTLGFGGDLITYGKFTLQWNEGFDIQTNAYEKILLSACKHKLRQPPLMTRPYEE